MSGILPSTFHWINNYGKDEWKNNRMSCPFSFSCWTLGTFVMEIQLYSFESYSFVSLSLSPPFLHLSPQVYLYFYLHRHIFLKAQLQSSLWPQLWFCHLDVLIFKSQEYLTGPREGLSWWELPRNSSTEHVLKLGFNSSIYIPSVTGDTSLWHFRNTWN